MSAQRDNGVSTAPPERFPLVNEDSYPSYPTKPSATDSSAAPGTASSSGSNYKPMPTNYDSTAPPQQYCPAFMPAGGYRPVTTGTYPQWHAGLCSCMSDLGACCEGTCCFSCQQGRQYNMLRTGKRNLDPFWCSVVMVLDGITGFCGSFISALYIRTRIRERFAISGGVCEDLAVTLCCWPCASCQHYSEMTARGMWPGGLFVSQPYYPHVEHYQQPPMVREDARTPLTTSA